MEWKQIIDPLKNLPLSAIVAIIPVAFIFWALIVRKMKGYKASIIATVIAIAIALFVYRMPVPLALLSTLNGALYGLFPICWIIIPAMFLFNITITSGQFEVIKHFMASITPDRRIQALLIAFSFGSFLEGTAGFGAPVAITAAMLVGLGFNPLYAAGICLIANTAPVAFGSIGIPITVASQVTSIPELAISKMVGRTLPVLSLLLPLYLVLIMCGLKKTKEVLPAIAVSGLSFALLQWSISNFLGPALPDVIAGVGSIICLSVFLKFWKPKTIWRFHHEPAATINTNINYTTGEIVRAFSPFIMLTIIIIAWGLQPVKQILNQYGSVEFAIPILHNAIVDHNNQLIPHIYKLNYLSAAGTAILISGIVSIPMVGLSLKQGLKVFATTVKQLKFPIITIASVLAFAYILNDSGITITLAETLAATGVLFPLFAPLLGWLGVFITGSDTSSNALFGKLQAATANAIGVDPVVTVGANISGGVVGKMISPQSIAVAAAAGNLVGRESDLFRFTVKHSFIMLFFISLIVFAQAYFLKWLTPSYLKTNPSAKVIVNDTSGGFIYLLLLAIVISVVVYIMKRVGDKSRIPQTNQL
ncbi:MAG: lactate permease LctP family transporter [Ginsengibacter sp.]